MRFRADQALLGQIFAVSVVLSSLSIDNTPDSALADNFKYAITLQKPSLLLMTLTDRYPAFKRAATATALDL